MIKNLKELNIKPIRRGWIVEFTLKISIDSSADIKTYACCNWKQVQQLMDDGRFLENIKPGKITALHNFRLGSIIKTDGGCVLKTINYAENLRFPEVLNTINRNVEEAFEELTAFILFGHIPEQFYDGQLKENE